jgi:hypothetical protein
MSRSGYSDCCENLELYRANVDRSIFGKRGQAFLRELADALDAMPDKELIEGDLIDDDGRVCAIGAVCKQRGLDVSGVDIGDPEEVGALVGIATCMAAEIEFENDERLGWCCSRQVEETPRERWVRMRLWVEKNLKAV